MPVRNRTRFMAPNVDFYEELEMLAASRRPCEIIFMKEGSQAVIHGVIADAFVDEEKTFLTMDSGLNIEIENLIEVNGVKQWAAC